MKLSEMLLRYRVKNKLTQGDMANILSLSKFTYRMLEHGGWRCKSSKPSNATICKLKMFCEDHGIDWNDIEID